MSKPRGRRKWGRKSFTTVKTKGRRTKKPAESPDISEQQKRGGGGERKKKYMGNLSGTFAPRDGTAKAT